MPEVAYFYSATLACFYSALDTALADRTPNEFATTHSGGKGGDPTALENAARFPLSLRTAAAGLSLKSVSSSSHLLETVT